METNKDTDDGIQINTPKQKENQKVIQSYFSKYKKYKLSKEYKNFIKNNKDIFNEKPEEPTLASFKEKEIINKNKCFFEADKNINNYFPQVHFKLKKKNNNNNKINNNKKNKKIEEEKYNFNNNLNADTVIGGSEIENIISDLNSRWAMIVKEREFLFSSSFELFDFLTNNILPFEKLDDYKIYMYNINNLNYLHKYKGGELYINLMKYLPLYFEKNNINENTAENYNEYNNNLNNINNNEYEYEQETNENNYFVESCNINPNNDTNFGFNNNC